MKKNTENTNKITLSPAQLSRVISPKTRTQYGKIINLLHKSTLEQKEDCHLVDASPLEIVEYLFSQRARFRPKTFLMYRTALVWWLPTIPVNGVVRPVFTKQTEKIR